MLLVKISRLPYLGENHIKILSTSFCSEGNLYLYFFQESLPFTKTHIFKFIMGNSGIIMTILENI